MRVFSNGGGVQSSAALVLSAQGVIDYPIHLWSNVGDDSEHPASLRYVREHLMPYAKEHGIEFHELSKVNRAGKKQTLYSHLMRDTRTIDVPVFLESGAPGNRKCTALFKIEVIDRWLRLAGVPKGEPAVVGIGISVDEIQRAGRGRETNYSRREYPLLDLGLRRSDCLRIVADAGLPQPPKSSCYFCPFHKPQQWAEMRRDEPELFEKAAVLEDALRARRVKLGRDQVFSLESVHLCELQSAQHSKASGLQRLMAVTENHATPATVSLDQES